MPSPRWWTRNCSATSPIGGRRIGCPTGSREEDRSTAAVRVRAGDPPAVSAAVRVGERRSRLLGLDAPTATRTEFTGSLSVGAETQLKTLAEDLQHWLSFEELAALAAASDKLFVDAAAIVEARRMQARLPASVSSGSATPRPALGTTAIEAAGPDTVIVIDHLGLLQPNEPPALAEPWADLPKLLVLAAYPNVRVKISGACTLSREPFPYDDIWDPVLRIINAFGIDRCMWGTDWTRTSGMLTYEQGVAPFRNTDRLSDSDRSKLMGGTLKKVYGW